MIGVKLQVIVQIEDFLVYCVVYFLWVVGGVLFGKSNVDLYWFFGVYWVKGIEQFLFYWYYFDKVIKNGV